MKRLIILIAVVLLFLPIKVKAEPYSELNEIIPDEAKEVLDEIDINTIDTSSVTGLSLPELFSAILPNFKESVKEPISALGKLFAILLLSAIINILKRNDASSKTYDIAAAAVCSLSILAPVSSVVVGINAVIQSLTDFMIGYIPIYSGLLIASGTPTAAASYSTGLIAASEVFSQLADKGILPLTGMILGLSAISGISSNELFSKIPALVKSITRWVFVTAVSLFLCLLSAQNVISGASDSVLLKSGKMFAGLVPVVGSSMSEAFSVTIGSMSVIKSEVGILGIIIVLIIFLPQLLNLLIWIGGIKIMAVSSETMGTQGIKRILSGIADALDMLLAVYVSVGVVFAVSTAVMINNS